MKANILVYDIGSTYTKASAFLLENGELAFLKRGQSPTTLEDVMIGAKQAEREVMDAGVGIADNCERYATCSAAGGLRMVAMGYMPRVTAKAAKEVSMCAGARVLEVVSHEEPVEFREEILHEIRPDIVLLAGGTDGGDSDSVIENAHIIVKAGVKGMVILACNADAQRIAEQIFTEGGVRYLRVPNIMPTVHQLNVKPSRTAIHTQFIRQITRAKGLDRFLGTLNDHAVMPTPGAVLLAGELLAKGTYEVEGAGAVLLADIGGATTDIHSLIPGLEELEDEERGLIVNNEKQFAFRTVEGNLGMRVSATGIVETVGPKAVLKRAKLAGVSPEAVAAYAQRLEKAPSTIPSTDTERALDYGLAVCAIETALKRHAGYFAQSYDPVTGTVPGTPTGRDLRHIEYVIGIGGILAHNRYDYGIELLEDAFSDPEYFLYPESPSYRIDADYILYALGAIGAKHPDEAVNYMKREIIGIS